MKAQKLVMWRKPCEEERTSIYDSQVSKKYENIKAGASVSFRKIPLHPGAKTQTVKL